MAGPGRSESNTLVGRTIGGKFRIIDAIGVGAMGSIYRAEQTSLGKTVAVKVLHQHLLGDASLSQRFHREARMAARITHPHCITIHDFGSTDDGLLYIAMEYIDGRDLSELVHQEHPLDLGRVLHIARQICGALDEAHNAGVIHRDLKPENVMVTRVAGDDDYVKVLDFGIAKPQDAATAGDSFQTMAGVVCGTPEYMSPEQARGEELDARSDLYAMGILLYFLTTNQLPFVGESPLTIVTKHIGEIPRAPRELNPSLPDAFNALILQLLAKRRTDRPASALALRKKLEQVELALDYAADTLQADDDTFVMGPHPGQRQDEPRAETTMMPSSRPALADAPAATPAPPEPNQPSASSDRAPDLTPNLTPDVAAATPQLGAPPAVRARGAQFSSQSSMFDTVPDPNPRHRDGDGMEGLEEHANKTVISARPFAFSTEREMAAAEETLIVDASAARHLLDTMRNEPKPKPNRTKLLYSVGAAVAAGLAAAYYFLWY